MTFLIMSVGVNTIQTQISDLQYQETIIGDYQETTTSEMQTIAEAAANSNVDLDDNPAYHK